MTVYNILCLTDTGALPLARGVATNTSIEHLTMQWAPIDPYSMMMAESVKNSSLKKLKINLSMSLGRNEHVIVGEKELILLLEDSHLESLELRAPQPFSL